MNTTKSKTIREVRLARIHILAKKNGYGEEAYRTILYCLTGFRSAADLSTQEMGDVIEFMEECLAERRGVPAPRTRTPRREVVSDEEALAILG